MPEFVLKLHSAFASMPPYTPMPLPLCPPILPAYMPPVLNTSWLDGWPQEYKAEPWLERLCSASPQITILIHYCIHYFLLLLPKLINLWGKNYSIQALDLLIMARPATICGHPEIYFCRSWSIHFVQNLVSCFALLVAQAPGVEIVLRGRRVISICARSTFSGHINLQQLFFETFRF